MRKATWPAVRKRLGISYRTAGDVAGCTAMGAHKKTNGTGRWRVEEAHSILAHVLTLDPEGGHSLESLFGLEPLPPLPDVDQLGGQSVDASEGA